MMNHFMRTSGYFYWVILVGILGVGLYLDAKPMLENLFLTRASIKMVAEQWQSEKNMIKQKVRMQNQVQELSKKLADYFSSEKTSIEVFARIWQLGEMYGLVMQVLEPIQLKNTHNVLAMHLLATGNFFQYTAFFSALAQASLPLLVTDFSLQLEKNNQVRIEMTLNGISIAMKKTARTSLLVSVSNAQDPFLEKNEFVLTDQSANDLALILSIPWQQLRLAGYLQEDQKRFALMKLPNEKTVAVSPGDYIGLEKMRVVMVGENVVMIEGSGQKIKIFQNDSSYLLKGSKHVKAHKIN